MNWDEVRVKVRKGLIIYIEPVALVARTVDSPTSVVMCSSGIVDISKTTQITVITE